MRAFGQDLTNQMPRNTAVLTIKNTVSNLINLNKNKKTANTITETSKTNTNTTNKTESQKSTSTKSNTAVNTNAHANANPNPNTNTSASNKTNKSFTNFADDDDVKCMDMRVNAINAQYQKLSQQNEDGADSDSDIDDQDFIEAEDEQEYDQEMSAFSDIDIDTDIDTDIELDIDTQSMEVIEAPAVSKWDAPNADNDLYVSQYVSEIIANLRESECSGEAAKNNNSNSTGGGGGVRGFYNSDYMQTQSDINPRMRCILVDWLVEVHRKFRLLPSTLFLALNLLDRYLSKTNLNRSKLQLVGCVCMWTASKYHEIYAPEMEDFVYISDNAFSAQDMIGTETEILKVLEFHLTVSTVYSYTQRYQAISAYYLNSKREQEIISNLILFCVENAVVSYELCRHCPSLVAAAAFVYACIGTKVFTEEQFVNENIAGAIGYEISELISVMQQLHKLVKNARKSKYKALTKKYSSATYSNVARLNFNKLRVQYLFSDEKAGQTQTQNQNQNQNQNQTQKQAQLQ